MAKEPKINDTTARNREQARARMAEKGDTAVEVQETGATGNSGPVRLSGNVSCSPDMIPGVLENMSNQIAEKSREVAGLTVAINQYTQEKQALVNRNQELEAYLAKYIELFGQPEEAFAVEVVAQKVEEEQSAEQQSQ